MCFVPLSCWHSVLFFLRMCQYKTLIYKKLLWVKKFSGYLAAMTWGAEEIVDLQPEVDNIGQVLGEDLDDYKRRG